MYSGTKNVAKAMQKILRGKGNAYIKAELGDKSVTIVLAQSTDHCSL